MASDMALRYAIALGPSSEWRWVVSASRSARRALVCGIMVRECVMSVGSLVVMLVD
jgi:hypothetical protein